MPWQNPPINFSVAVLRDADQLSKKIAGEVLRLVITASPVDTGAFRQNWRTAIGYADITTDNLVDKVGNTAINRGLVTIVQGGGLGKLVSISNSLPYSVRLNNGYSKQAPIGFVDLSLQTVLNRYR